MFQILIILYKQPLEIFIINSLAYYLPLCLLVQSFPFSSGPGAGLLHLRFPQWHFLLENLLAVCFPALLR